MKKILIALLVILFLLFVLLSGTGMAGQTYDLSATYTAALWTADLRDYRCPFSSGRCEYVGSPTPQPPTATRETYPGPQPTESYPGLDSSVWNAEVNEPIDTPVVWRILPWWLTRGK